MASSDLRGLRNALREFRTLKTDISSPAMQTLLEVALHEQDYGNEPGYLGMPLVDLIKALDLTPPAVSRNVAMLSKYDYKKSRSDAWDLVELIDDPNNRRYRIIRLTRKGRLFVKAVQQSMAGGGAG